MPQEDKYVQTLNNVNYSEDKFRSKQEYDVLYINDNKICEKHETFNFDAAQSCPMKKKSKK